MSTTPTPERTARVILRVLVHGLRLRAGQGVLVDLLRQRLHGEGVEWHDVPQGLRHAASQGWLLYDERNAWVRLMEAGFLSVS